MDNLEIIRNTLSMHGFSIIEQYKVPSTSAVFLPLESVDERLRSHLAGLYPGGLYSHQVGAINYGVNGLSFCISTPTASGKTVIFSAIAINKIISKKGTKILALYPTKALIHDQYRKWRDLAKPFGLRAAIIHGGIEKPERLRKLSATDIILMTPDVLHAWVMTELNNPIVSEFLRSIGLMILDEAHIYDGIFGTNMAFLIRRLRCHSCCDQIITSTATIGNAQEFIKQLTGIDAIIIDNAQNGSYIPEKTFLLSMIPARQVDLVVKSLINNLHTSSQEKFIVFLDSRMAVEETASSVMNGDISDDNDIDNVDLLDDVQTIRSVIDSHNVLPYRSGYEEEDRIAIQNALEGGTLKGVIATSALELGIDIGEISLVVNIGTPTSIKSLWQRAGRAGRMKEGLVFIIDTNGRLAEIGLSNYLSFTPEPNWIYMENEYLQYSNALCTADEFLQSTPLKRTPLNDLPLRFAEYLDNELSPKSSIPNELHALKQQSMMHSHPHFAFPLRNSPEKQYAIEIQNSPHIKIGHVTYSQVCQESYPGAIYRYMGQPFRIWKINHSKGVIYSQKIKNKFGKTRPIVQNMVFPDFNEVFMILGQNKEFMCECGMQVSSRINGFTESYGRNRKVVTYGSDNIYSQKPLLNYFDTTGICFYFDLLNNNESIGAYVRSAFCRVCSVYERDVGVGSFISKTHPLENRSGEVRGFSIFDVNKGSLRLTKMLVEKIEDVFKEAMRMANQEGATIIYNTLSDMLVGVSQFKSVSVAARPSGQIKDSAIINVVLEGQIAICNDGVSIINQEVEVLGFIYTRQGLKYNLRHQDPTVKWQVSENCIFPISGITKVGKYNIDSGELESE